MRTATSDCQVCGIRISVSALRPVLIRVLREIEFETAGLDYRATQTCRTCRRGLIAVIEKFIAEKRIER